MAYAKIPVPDAERLFRNSKSYEAGTPPARRTFVPYAGDFEFIIARAIETVTDAGTYFDGIIVETPSDSTPTGDALEEAKVWLTNFAGHDVKGGDHAFVYANGTATHESVERDSYVIFDPFPVPVELVKSVECSGGKITVKKTTIKVHGYVDDDSTGSGTSGSGTNSLGGSSIGDLGSSSFGGDSFGGE